jgi:predicted transcriptional regulator of viral defense system
MPMVNKPGDIDDMSVQGRLYTLAEGQGGFFTAQQAIGAGVARSTLTYHARDRGMLRRAGRGVYRLRRFPSSPYEHVICAWLGLSRVGAVVSHVSALELMGLTDLIADEVHVTVPRSKRGAVVPAGVRVHFTARPIEGRHRHTVSGMPVTGVERTIADVVRANGWSEQVDLAVRQSLSRGMTTPGRLSEALPKTWQRQVAGCCERSWPDRPPGPG